MYHINYSIVGIIILGLIGLIIGPLGGNSYFFTFYTKGIECYLFGITAFWVLKRVIFYRLQTETEVIRLVKTSNYQFNFIVQGILLSLIYLAYAGRYCCLYVQQYSVAYYIDKLWKCKH